MYLSQKQISNIKQETEIESNKKIVRVDVSHENDGWSDNESNYNIYCVEKDYSIVWQVSEKKSEPVSIFGEVDPFYFLGKDDSGTIIADRFSGFVYEINPDTGEATRIGFNK